MKKLRFFLPLAALGLLASCANEEVKMPDQPVEPSEGGYYLTFNLDMPSTRAGETYLEGEATEEEIKAEELDVYLLNSNKKVVFVKKGLTVADGATATEGNIDKKYTVSISLENADFTTLKSLAGDDFYVLAVANAKTTNHSYTLDASSYSDPMIPSFTLNTTSDIAKVVDGSNKGRTMLMSSHDLLKSEALKTKAQTEADVRSAFTGNDTKTLPLGTIELDRAVARIDIKDGSQNSNWTYNISRTDATSDINIKLTSIQPFNINDAGVLFRQTAGSNPSKSNSVKELFGNGSWIVDGSWSNYTAGSDYTKTITNFKNKLSALKEGSPIDIAASEISSLTGNSYTDGDATWYYWMYVGENTVPSVDMMKEGAANRETYVTGVAFKFAVQAQNNGGDLTEDDASDDTKRPSSSSYDSQNKKLRLMLSNGKYQDVIADNSDKKFYLTYYGYINHNENPTKDNPAIQDYVILRNHVYRIFVNKIENLPNPHDADAYNLTLNVNVLKWTKKDVGFEF